MTKENKVNLGLKVTKSVFDRLQEESKMTNLSVSAIVTLILQNAIDKTKDGESIISIKVK